MQLSKEFISISEESNRHTETAATFSKEFEIFEVPTLFTSIKIDKVGKDAGVLVVNSLVVSKSSSRKKNQGEWTSGRSISEHTLFLF